VRNTNQARKLSCAVIALLMGSSLLALTGTGAHAAQHGDKKAGTGQPTMAQAAALFEKIAAGIPGGDIPPCRNLADPYPEFNGVAVDPVNNIVLFSDTNLKSLLVYPRTAGSAHSGAITPPLRQILGPATYLSFACGVALDPRHKTIYAGENDVGDDIASFPYSANGNYPARTLATPHEVYGLGLSFKLGQEAITVEQDDQIVFFKLGATGAAPPLREVRGERTGLADPHGLFWDDAHDEVVVTNHGNWARGAWDPDYQGGGHYQPPSVEVFAADAQGDAKPLRVISGPKTQLNWPAGVSVAGDEIAVANMAGASVTIYRRTASGDVAPLRQLEGPKTGITIPMGVAFDPVNHELWVANFGHTGLVFDAGANGDVAPKRIIRNAPAGTPVAGFGNPMAMAFDTRRQELLVPN